MRSLRRALGFGVVTAMAALLFAQAPFAPELEEDVGLAWLFHLRGPRAVPPVVAVVAIDGTAAQALGQSNKLSEWPRGLHARLIDALAGARARVIVFDVSFATTAREPAEDRALAAALERAGNVLLLDFLEQADAGGTHGVVERRLPPHPLLAGAAVAHGPFPLPKSGRVHAYWLFKPGGTATLPTLASWLYDRGGSESAPEQELGAGDEARYLDFYGPPRSVPTIGFHQVLAAAERGADGAGWLRKTFEDHAVFVGFSAAHPSEQDRVRDDYGTVFSRADGLDLSGVEIVATAFANLFENRAPQPLSFAAQAALLLAWGLLLGTLCAVLRGGLALITVLAACVGYVALAHACFATTARWLPLVTPLLVQTPLALLGGLLRHHADERHERRRLGAVVRDLLPTTVVEELSRPMRGAEPAGPAGQPTFGVFIMTDIQGFTPIAETLSPTEAARLLNDHFALIFPAVEANGGSVSEIDGDGMLAFWLDDGARPHVRRAACQAALEIAERTQHCGTPGCRPPLPTRIGVHGGPITLARVGASRHHEYRMVGDAANTAGRIEALSKHLGTWLLVSEEVLDGLDDLLTRPMGTFLLMGKSTPVRVHELLGRASAASVQQRRLCAAFNEALGVHDARRWDEAVERWSAFLQAFPNDGPARFYLRQAMLHVTTPPSDDWDGVIRMASK